MAYLIEEKGQRTEIKPAGKEFTQDELKGILGGALDVLELPGDLYAVSVRSARKIGAEENKAAKAGYVIHMAHMEVEGKLASEGVTQLLPAPEFYGPVIFCRGVELGSDPVYTGNGDEATSEGK